MIDTIVLLIPSQHFKILHPNSFTPSVDLVFNKQAAKAFAYPTKYDVKHGNYLPRLMIAHRMNLQGKNEIMLTIEASLPKLIFGNNVEELRVKDFDQVIHILHEKLVLMGILIEPKNLQQADSITVHFAKNIVLKDGSTPFHYIQKIKECCTPSRLDNNQTNYRNSGHSFKWHCNSYEVVFYDKLFDLQAAHMSKKRAIDSDNVFNMKKLNVLRSKKKKFEILRFEVRLNKRATIKKLFESLNIKNKPTLQSLFKPTISKKVLLYYLDLIEQKRSQISHFKPNSDQALLSTLIVYNPSAKPKDILSCIGYKKLLETMSADEIKKIFKKEHERSWYKIMSTINNFIVPTSHNSFEIIKKQISKYKALKLPPTQKPT